MLISTKGTYAIRVMTYMAENGYIDNYICSCDLSDELEISKKYLESILTLLSKNKIIDVSRGKCGGYKLNRKPEEYKLIDILKVTEEDLAPVACLKDKTSECKDCDKCPGYKTFNELHDLITNFFDNKTIKDLMNNCKK